MKHLITYAKDKSTGETRNIKDVVSGLVCNCVCGNCGGDLEACKGTVIILYMQIFLQKKAGHLCN